MLKLKYLIENFGLAKEVLKKNWEFDQDTLDEMLGYFRVSSNAIYPYRSKGEVRYLRLTPVEEKLQKNLTGEMEFIQYLMENKYPALEPIKSKSGESFLQLDTPWGNYFASSFRGVKGKQIDRTDKSNAIMYEYGKTLGTLHSLSAQYTPNIKKWDHMEALEWMAGVLNEYKAPECAFIELARIKEDLGKLPIDADNYGLIHYDFEFDNVFYNAGTQSCSVIDFDDGMYHWYALDIVQALECMEDELSGEACEVAKEEFLKGYRFSHCLTEEMQESYPYMSRFTNLYGYARLIRCVAETFDVEPDWMTELRSDLNTVISKKEKRMNR